MVQKLTSQPHSHTVTHAPMLIILQQPPESNYCLLTIILFKCMESFVFSQTFSFVLFLPIRKIDFKASRIINSRHDRVKNNLNWLVKGHCYHCLNINKEKDFVLKSAITSEVESKQTNASSLNSVFYFASVVSCQDSNTN